MSVEAAKGDPEPEVQQEKEALLPEAVKAQFEAQETLRRVEDRLKEHRQKRWELERAIEEARRVNDSARLGELLTQRQPIEVEQELLRNRTEALVNLRNRAAHVDSLVKRAQGLRQAMEHLRAQLAPGGHHDRLIRDTEQQLAMFQAARATDERSLAELERQLEELAGTTSGLSLPEGLELLHAVEAALGQR